jgi:hypothetical protein
MEEALTALMKRVVGEDRVGNRHEGNGRYKRDAPMYTVTITVFMDQPLLDAQYQLHLTKRA